MKLAISNIGFDNSDREAVYALLNKYNFSAIEIAPSIFAGEKPYDSVAVAKKEKQQLFNKHSLKIASMQSIWYGQIGNIFIKEEAAKLTHYTKKAVDFAKELEINNLVFGCPKNRVMPENAKQEDVLMFFDEISQYASDNGTNIALEANPEIYGTNFCNTSESAFEFAKKVKNLKVNYDFGTFLVNSESLRTLSQNIELVNHVHLSEPYLEAISLTCERKKQHEELANLLKSGSYKKYVSIEMKVQKLTDVECILEYVANVFS